MSNEWLHLDPEELDSERDEMIQGVEVRVLVSPYDVPEAVRGFYDKHVKRFVIEFQYIGDEPLKRQSFDEYVHLRTGKNSHRLYAIEIAVDALKATAVGLRMGVQQEVAKTLDSLVDRPIDRRRRNNYRVAQTAIANKKEQLFGAFGQTSGERGQITAVCL